MSHDPIYVTRPLLPPLNEFMPYLERIWASQQLTNGGPFHEELEGRLAAYLGVDHLALFANGTIALMTALQALEITGEVITTPYSFVATAHCLVWNNLAPVFVDIDPASCNLDPSKIEAAITERTTAILPVHCYGRPCDVVAIEAIAARHGLKVIYDAAHAFGVGRPGGELLRRGDMSMLSFHATKVFHTFEGGAIICPDEATKRRIDFLKNFGFADEVTIVAAGINGKMNEVQAAMGLLQLEHIDAAIGRRGRIEALYRSELDDVAQVNLFAPACEGRTNHSYFPILIDAGGADARDAVYVALREQDIFARRYFYPLISEMPMYRQLPSADPANLPSAHFIAERVLCLPIYDSLSEDDAMRVVRALKASLPR
jgi:dTDP-4-amino-4,6-dideoxygalactose transaminase